jgi:hypothetical protein
MTKMTLTGEEASVIYTVTCPNGHAFARSVAYETYVTLHCPICGAVCFKMSPSLPVNPFEPFPVTYEEEHLSYA